MDNGGCHKLCSESSCSGCMDKRSCQSKKCLWNDNDSDCVSQCFTSPEDFASNLGCWTCDTESSCYHAQNRHGKCSWHHEEAYCNGPNIDYVSPYYGDIVNAQDGSEESTRYDSVVGHVVVERFEDVAFEPQAAVEYLSLWEFKVITGSLILRDNTKLTSFDMSNLKTIKGNIEISNCPALQKLKFHPELAVSGCVAISGNVHEDAVKGLGKFAQCV